MSPAVVAQWVREAVGEDVAVHKETLDWVGECAEGECCARGAVCAAASPSNPPSLRVLSVSRVLAAGGCCGERDRGGGGAKGELPHLGGRRDRRARGIEHERLRLAAATDAGLMSMDG